MNQVLIFSHTDLDGIGGIIVSKKYAEINGLPYEYYKCNYHEIDNQITRALDVWEPDELHSILISDISVNSDTAELLNRYYMSGVNVVLCDHHDTADWLNQYSWAFVAEKDSRGILRCGTYWMAKQFPEIYDELKVFVKTVDSWDTWKWKDSGNTYAKDLNSLLSVMGHKEFISYIDSLDMSTVDHPKCLFTDEARIMVSVRDKIVNKTAWACGKSMWTGNYTVQHEGCAHKLKGGVVFCNRDISDIANYILDNHPELDFLMLVNLPRAISFRTQKELPVPMGVLAKAVTGSGGGHPISAGSVISQDQFPAIFSDMIATLSSEEVSVDHLSLRQ